MPTAACTARRASTSKATGAPKRAISSSPTTLSTWPPTASTSAPRAAKTSFITSVTTSGSIFSVSAVKPAMSAKSTATTRRSLVTPCPPPPGQDRHVHRLVEEEGDERPGAALRPVPYFHRVHPVVDHGDHRDDHPPARQNRRGEHGRHQGVDTRMDGQADAPALQLHQFVRLQDEVRDKVCQQQGEPGRQSRLTSISGLPPS